MFVIVFSNNLDNDLAHMAYGHGGLEEAKKLAKRLSEDDWATVLSGVNGKELARYSYGKEV